MRSPTVLAVDDDPMFLKTLGLILTNAQVTPMLEDNPVRALERAKAEPPDLIVVDYEMPAMTGLQFYERLQESPQTAGLPVWVCSAKGDEDTIAAAYRLGIADYVVKPVGPAAFRAKVQRFFSRSTMQLARQAVEQHAHLVKAETHIRQMLPRLPAVQGLDLGLIYKPHDRVGGDFYDFFMTPTGTTCFVVGDVSGHGVEAAVIHPMARKTVQMEVKFAPTVEQGLNNANTNFRKDLPPGIFVALLLAEWTPATRQVRMFRLGLPHPLYRDASRAARIVMSGGTILGMHPPERFANLMCEAHVTLNPGEVLLIHSDGAIEASTPNGGDLGFEGLRRILADAPAMGAQAIADGIHASIRASASAIDDDITLLVMQGRA